MSDPIRHTSIATVTAPAIEPVTPAEAMEWARIDEDDRGGGIVSRLIADLITATRQAVELRTGRALITQTLRAQYDGFPSGSVGRFRLPRCPAQSVTTIKYYASDGTLTTLDSGQYTLDADAVPGIVARASGATWPTVQTRQSPVQIAYVAGYGLTAAAVPVGIRLAILAAVKACYEFPDSQIEATLSENRQIRDLLCGYVVHG